MMFAVIAQLGERQTEDLKVPGSIPGRGTLLEGVSAPAQWLCIETSQRLGYQV